MENGIKIECVDAGSVAEELEIEAGDTLRAINGHMIRDIIDYDFYSADDELVLLVEKTDGDVWEIEFEREEGESLGLRFEAPVPRYCENSCLFCFVDQLPQGLRSSLYVKDEDYRLSFLYGNFVTLTSLRHDELERIREQRLSPLYISVHATDPAVRGVLLGTPERANIMELLRELADSRITMHTQVVLCPGINDGIHLEKTVSDLADLFPWVASLAIVPVGLTRHRAHLTELRPITREYALDFIASWRPQAQKLSRKLGTPFLFIADEFFLKADVSFPPLDEYGDLPQLENGVGMIPLFLAEAKEVLEKAQRMGPAVVTIVTGTSPFRFVKKFLQGLSEKTAIRFQLVAVQNSLLGDSVTVTGLVPGSDVLESLRGLEVGDLLAIPDVMLKEKECVFIDEVRPEILGAELGTDVIVFEASPAGFYSALRERLVDQ